MKAVVNSMNLIKIRSSEKCRKKSHGCAGTFGPEKYKCLCSCHTGAHLKRRAEDFKKEMMGFYASF